MYKLLRMAVFALPLAGGVAWAQASGTSGSAGAPGSAMTPPVTDDTRTPMQQKAGRLDDTAPEPALPGDATKPVEIPNRVEDKSTMPDVAPPTDKTIDRKSDTTMDNDRHDTSTDIQNKSTNDANKDQLDSDK